VCGEAQSRVEAGPQCFIPILAVNLSYCHTGDRTRGLTSEGVALAKTRSPRTLVPQREVLTMQCVRKKEIKQPILTKNVEAGASSHTAS
jgi:hypothetical protein